MTNEMVALMRENAALATLEAEVILALKFYQVGDDTHVKAQIQKVYESLEMIDTVRRRNGDMKAVYDGTNS
jgi:hypothetical protein